jgi:hypothetical protein
VGALFAKSALHSEVLTRIFLGFLFKNYLDQPCFYPKELEGTRRFSSSTMNCSGACKYGTYRVLYQVDSYPEVHPGPTVKIEAHGPRCVDFKL